MDTRRSNSERANALWGSGSRGESRSSALWGGRGGKNLAVGLSVLALAAPMFALGSSGSDRRDAYVSPALLAAAKSNPAQKFSVVVQGDVKHGTQAVAQRIQKLTSDMPRKAAGLKKKFVSINGIS